MSVATAFGIVVAFATALLLFSLAFAALAYLVAHLHVLALLAALAWLYAYVGPQAALWAALAIGTAVTLYGLLYAARRLMHR